MIASERKLYILNKLRQKGVVNLKEIAAEMGAAEITIRRDFEKLEQEGKLKRVQGGAALEDAELTAGEKTTLNAEEKRKAARYAAALVQDGDCIFVDCGTTLAAMGEFLADKNIKIVTNNDLLLRKIRSPRAEFIVTGGRYLAPYNMFAGPLTQDYLRQFHFSCAFIGCTGIDLEQEIAYDTEMESVLIKHIAIQNSERCQLLIDQSKLQKKGFLKVTELSWFESVICGCREPEGLPDSPLLIYV